MVHYKIIYFDSRGRAEVSRLLFVAAGKPYDDVRLTTDQWAAEKSKTPFGQLPVLEIDGERFGQSISIATFLAREFGFHGKNNIESLKIDQAVQLIVDFTTAAVKVFFEKDEVKKAEILKNIKEVETPKYLKLFETLLEKSGTGFFVGKTITLADIFLYDILYSFGQHKFLTTDGYPLVKALVKNVESNDKIKAYLATRKQTVN